VHYYIFKGMLHKIAEIAERKSGTASFAA
jgi:hypothetical protein